MKPFIFVFLFSLLWSCSGETAQADTSVAEEAVTTQSTTAPATNTLADITHLCDLISGEMIAAALVWEGSNGPMPTTMRDGSVQACYHSSTNNVGTVTISMSQQKERTIEVKGLEKNFNDVLANSKSDLAYEAIEDSFGDQTIYGYGKRNVGYTYRLRWRLENHTDYIIEANYKDELPKDVVLERLKVLAAKL